MSAPSLLAGPPQTFATAYSRTQRHAQPTGIDANAHADVATYTGALDAIDRLALSLADLCRTAVDPLAIVAGLEAEGFNDRTARDRYGLPDLFDLAEELHRRVPRDLARAGSPSAPPPTGTARAILRGLLFATPSLCAMTFLVTNVGGAGRALLACVQILAWGYGQGIAHVAYGRLNNADRAAASRVLRMGTSHSLLASAALLGAMELTLGTPPAALLPAATSLWFCLAAIPALVLGAEFRLAATLVPVTVGAIAAWLSASDGVALIGSQLSVAATVLTMLHLTRTSTTPTAGPTSS
ncbi:MAG: hypothetical protein ACRDVE_07650, partial [Actinocrinis sp.]